MNRVRNPFNALFHDVTPVQDELARLFGRAEPVRRPPPRPARR